MIIYNPRKDSVVAKFDGATYLFRGGEKKDIFNTFAARHILLRWGKYGLVDVTYNEKAAEKYLDYELFAHERGEEGLLTYLETLTEKKQNFESFDMECGDKKTVERLRLAKQAKNVIKEIKAVEMEIEDYKKIDQKTILDNKVQRLLAEAEKLKLEASKINGLNSSKSSGSSSNRAS